MTLSPVERADMISSALTEVRVVLEHLTSAPEHADLAVRLERLESEFAEWELRPPSLLDGMAMTNDVLGLLLVVTRLKRKSSARP